jgi:hypothetical protein
MTGIIAWSDSRVWIYQGSTMGMILSNKYSMNELLLLMGSKKNMPNFLSFSRSQKIDSEASQFLMKRHRDSEKSSIKSNYKAKGPFPGLFQ